MTRSGLAVAAAVLLLLLGASAIALWSQFRREGRLSARLEAVRLAERTGLDANRQGAAVGLSGAVAAAGSAIAKSGLLSRNTLAALEQTLAATNVRGSNALGLFVGMKIFMLFFMPVVAFSLLQHFNMSPLMRNVGTAGAALGGLLAPDWWIGWRYKKYLRAVTNGLADAMDLMVICAEAGLSFEPAMTRVAREIQSAHPAVSQEFGLTASEFRVSADSKVALRNMATRTNLDGIKRMTATLAQTMKYGTPLSDALRVLSAEMRHELLIRYETRAARLPVLLTMPMILFILPCIFLIVGGPAAIQVSHSFHHDQPVQQDR
ncbi:MAG TPA: type II secretion system F family protein [Rhodopila sp.]